MRTLQSIQQKQLNLIIQDGTSHFIAELHIQQVRKLVLEMIQRLPGNDHLKPHVKNILSLAFKLLSKFYYFCPVTGL